MLFDIVIVLVVLGTAWMGFQRGMVQPLLAELFGLGTLLVILHNRDAFAALADTFFHANAVLAAIMAVILAIVMGYVGARLGGVIRKMPAVQGPDGFVGVWLQVLTGIGISYLLISAVIVMDQVFMPITTTNITAKQLQAVETGLKANTLTAGAVDSHDLEPFRARAARGSPVAIGDLPGISQLNSLDRDILMSQLAASHLAPAIVGVGRHIPGMGHYTSRDLPKRT